MWAGGPLHGHPRGSESQAQASHPSSRELSPKPQGGWLVLPSDLPQTTGLFLQGLPKATSTRWRVIVPGAASVHPAGPGSWWGGRGRGHSWVPGLDVLFSLGFHDTAAPPCLCGRRTFMSTLRCTYLTDGTAHLPMPPGLGKSEPFHHHAPQDVFIARHAPASSLREPV